MDNFPTNYQGWLNFNYPQFVNGFIVSSNSHNLLQYIIILNKKQNVIIILLYFKESDEKGNPDFDTSPVNK